VETYILIGLCLGAWLITLGLFQLVLLRGSELAFVVGSLTGLVAAAGAGGAYYAYLAACRTCI
jgi:hypothetical protein